MISFLLRLVILGSTFPVVSCSLYHMFVVLICFKTVSEIDLLTYSFSFRTLLMYFRCIFPFISDANHINIFNKNTSINEQN